MKAELVKTWKVQVTAAGVNLTINGNAFELGDSKDALLFDLQRAVSGYTVPDREPLKLAGPWLGNGNGRNS